MLDLVASLLLAASPWLLGFEAEVYGQHLLFGAAGDAVVLMTM